MPIPVFTRQRVVIVGKTHMKSGICVGGILDANGQPVRLLPVGQAWHPTNTPFQIGEIWDMDLAPRHPVVPPHVEDHDERNAVRVGAVPNLPAYIRQKIQPVTGAPSAMFNGRIAFRASGTAYIDTQQPLPPNSVGFWILPHPLVYDPFNNKPRYRLNEPNPSFLVTYVGVAPTIRTIPAGTLVRLSLARPWTNADDPAEHTRCSVQLSGWYL